MKLFLTVSILIAGLVSGRCHAQMAAASPVAWDLDHTITVAVERDSVWTLLKDYSLVNKLSDGFVLSIANKDNIMPILREVTFKDGTKREEHLTQVEEQHRFLVYDVRGAAMPKGITEVSCAVFVREKGDDAAVVNWKVIVKGDKEAKKLYLPHWKAEIEAYGKGVSEYLAPKAKAIPATRM